MKRCRILNVSEPITRLTNALAGRYRIDRALGAGGMATVYLAEDLKHHRKVAIKLLREDVSASVSTARFRREIEIAAQLQHPHILPLLDSGEADGLFYYVMPFVKEESLRQRLKRVKELPVGDAVAVLLDVLDALTHAHGLGVVHRDIKPDNVMLSGRHALVTDFGIARAVSNATELTALTSMGIALGTPAYMAPEQAAGDAEVDHRADIYAVGVLAYELLAGRPPFTGTTVQVLTAQVTQTPEPLSEYRGGLPVELEQVVMRCLEKNVDARWQTAEQLLQALMPFAQPSGATARTTAWAPPMAARHWKVAFGVAVFLLAAVAGTLVIATRAGPGPLSVGRSAQLTPEPGLEIHPAISPDGKLVAYAAGTSLRMRIFIRAVAGGRTIPLSDDTTAVESNPRWSSDGSQLLFLTHGGVSIAPALGGAARRVIPAGDRNDVLAAAWSPDGAEVAYARGDSVFVSDLLGERQRFIASVRDPSGCDWSPNGRWIACVTGNSPSLRPGPNFGNIQPSAIVLIPSEGGEPIPITGNNSLHQSPEWSTDGRHIYFVSNLDGPRDLYAQAVGGDGRLRGSAVRITTGSNIQSFSLSHGDRQLAYAVYAASANIWSQAIPTGGSVTSESATPLTAGSQIIESIRVSKDGRWLLYDSNLQGTANVYRIRLDGGQPERLTAEPFDVFSGDLSPDGREVAYHSFRNPTRDIEVKPLDGGPIQQVTSSPAQESYPVWSPDGRSLAYSDQDHPNPSDRGTYLLHRDSTGRWSGPVRRTTGCVNATWSPDGRFLACTFDGGQIGLLSPDSGTVRVVYQPRAGEARAAKVVWARDGRGLYFKSHDREGRAALWSIPTSGGRPRLLIRFDDPNRLSNRPDFDTDGRRFYFTIEDRQSDLWIADIVRR